jgi:hypothetical protein
MKTKTYPEIGFLRLRDVIGDGDHPGESLVPGRRGLGGEVSEAGEAGRANVRVAC